MLPMRFCFLSISTLSVIFLTLGIDASQQKELGTLQQGKFGGLVFSYNMIITLKVSFTNPYAADDNFFGVIGTDKNRTFRFMQISKDYILYDFIAPFERENRGLVNANTIHFSMKPEVKEEKFKQVKVKLNGCIAAQGIASNAENASMFEAATVGYLKEHTENAKNAEIFMLHIKNEFTSKKNDSSDAGLRTSEAEVFMKKHMTQCLDSKYDGMRIGEYIRINVLHGNDDPHASVKLNEFDIHVIRN